MRLLRRLTNGRLFTLVLVLMAMVLSLGCDSGPKVYSDADVPIVVREGETFLISVPDSPDSGYRWDAEFEESDFELVSDELVFAEDRECKVCAWGDYLFTFTAIDAGESEILVTLRRPLEEDNIAIQHVFDVTVTPR